MSKRILILGTLILLCLVDGDVLAQCAMCRATVESNLNETGGGIGAGLNTGILYLMAIPYILLTVIGVLWYRSTKTVNKGESRNLA